MPDRAESASAVAAPSTGEALRYLVRLLVLLRRYWPALGKGILLGFAVGAVGLVPRC